MSINKLIILFFLTLLFSCDQQEKKEKVTLLQDGIWRMEMTLNAHTLPFNFLLNRKKGNYEMTILNSEERIFIDSITVINDSIFIKLPVFESEFFLSIVDQKH